MLNKTVIKPFKRIKRPDEVWNLGTIFSQLARWSTRTLVSGIFKQPRTSIVVPNVFNKFSKIGNVFFSDEVYDVSISWNYILLSVNYNFGLGKWAKSERNDGKLLCVKTSPVDWSVYTWAQWISKTEYARIVWNSLTSSLEVARYDCLPYRFLLKLLGMTACPTVFP